MKTKFKRFLCMLLAVMMIASTPMTVFAENRSGLIDGSLSLEDDSPIDAVVKNTATDKFYQDLQSALKEVAAGETLTLLKDAESSIVTVPVDATLDLNGYMLTAAYVTSFGDIVDGSEEDAGVLKVADKQFMIQNDNAQLPVKCAEGYKFFTVEKISAKYTEEASKFSFKPYIEEGAHELLKAGAEQSGVSIKVHISWKSENGNRTQDFQYTDSLVKSFLNGYDANTGKYDYALTLVVKNAEKYEDMTFSAVVVSNKGVSKTSETYGPTTDVVPTEKPGKLEDDVILDTEKASAVVAEGTKVDGKSLALTTEEMSETTTDVKLSDGEEMLSLNVHVDGVAKDNTVPVLITIDEIAPEFLNQGNITLYHVENGVTVEMARVYSLEEVDEHNEFYYDILTGTITMALASFSEIAVVAEEAKWEGNFDYTWYTNATALADGESTTVYEIANADQLAAFGAIVGGMAKDKEGNKISQNTFKNQTVKLLADVNLDDSENKNTDKIFYPIGYYYTDDKNEDKTTGDYYSTVNSFEGIFDGNGHTISNFYQNTWEIKGDYDGNYYSDAMGLFGYVVGSYDEKGVATGGIIKNLTVDNFSSDGEFTPTGVIAAYAVNSTFENIAITNCNPRVYNTGNGGIVGIGGNSDDPETYKLTFNNITIDNTNKITALWGSWDVACGGLVGMFRGAGHVYMTNCHVAAQMDVYNDVCGNYQYYWYRYSGMMVGTNKNMTTDTDGYTVPETEKFHAENCTVHFGDWNDYYYCELVANSLASYTHDHQFSRLTEVESIDVEKMTVTVDEKTTEIPASGRCNYVVVTDEEATKKITCYHFVDGKVHNHEDYNGDGVDDYETVNGESILVENNQHIYLPFNQLFTGYGWGVKHIPVYNGEDYAFEGITILDREVADSVVKFEKADTAKDSYDTGTTVTIGELFKATSQKEVAIDMDNVQVTVSPVGETSTASGSYTADSENWTQGTLTFDGVGKAEITITDYYFCMTTTLEVEINGIEKFDLVFENTDQYLYRVGNKNPVALGSLFKALDKVAISNVSVAVNSLDENTNVLSTYTENTADWIKGTLTFNGTGPVNVTISADGAIPLTLKLEVVDATNVTNYSGLKNQNSVLLNDITMSTGGSYYLSGATLYGNGFTFDMQAGTYAAGGSTSANYVMGLHNANLDNIKVVGAVYTEYGATVQSAYNRASVLSTGNNTITNSYISNCASAVRVKDGNIEIVNSTIKGGNFANIDIRGGHVVLDNVTTINQVNGNDTAKDGKVVVGLGVVVYYENVLDTTSIEIKNGITQYNHLSKKQAENYIKDSSAKSLTNAMFGDDFTKLQYTDGSDKWVNAGIVSMTDTVGADNISEIAGYTGSAAQVLGKDGYVYTKIPNATSIVATVPEYITVGQGAISPKYNFDYTSKNYVEKTDGSNDYCYEDVGTVYISMDEGETFSWDTSILEVTKNNQTLNYSVSMNGTDYTGKSITFSKKGNYEVMYTYTDSNNYGVDAKGNIITYEKTYTKTVHISVAVIEALAKNAEFKMGSSNVATEKITVNNVTYISATGVTADNSTWSYMTIGDKKIYYPIVEAKLTSTKGTSTYAYFPVFENVVTITDYTDNGTGNEFTYDSDEGGLPSALTAVKGIYKPKSDVPYWYNLTDANLTQSGPSKIFKWASSSDAPSDPEVYKKVLCYKSPEISADRNAYITLVQYSYTDATNTKYYYYVGYTLAEFKKSCVTSDTLVTLADGTQKRIDEVSYTDILLVWNFFEGEYASVPASIIFYHGDDLYRVVKLNFDDGTTVKTINGHGFFDVEENKFVFINEENVEQYIGNHFVKTDGDGYTEVELVSYDIIEEYTGCYSIQSAMYNNFITEGMFSLTVPPYEGWFDYFEFGENMKYDEEKMQDDIQKYGLYSYEDFSDYVTYEQFIAFNGPYLKVLVGRGVLTYDQIIELIKIYVQ